MPRSCAATTAPTNRSNGGSPSTLGACLQRLDERRAAARDPQRGPELGRRADRCPAVGDELERAAQALARGDREAHHVDDGRELGRRTLAGERRSARVNERSPTDDRRSPPNAAATSTAPRPARRSRPVAARARASAPGRRRSPPTPHVACSARKPDGVEREPGGREASREVAAVVAEQRAGAARRDPRASGWSAAADTPTSALRRSAGAASGAGRARRGTA